MDIHKIIEGLKGIDAKIGEGQLTKWSSDNVYCESKAVYERVGNRTRSRTKREFNQSTILGSILLLVSSVDSNEFKKWKDSGFDMNHQFKCDVEIESDEYSEEAANSDIEVEFLVKRSHTVDEHYTLLDLVISSKCDNLKKILLEQGAKVSPDPKYIGYMIVSGVFTICATVAMACDQSKLTIIAGTFVAAASFACLCYSAYQYINPSIAKAEKGPLNSLGNPQASGGVATQYRFWLEID